MRVSRIELITEMSEQIKWLLIDKNAFYKYEKKNSRRGGGEGGGGEGEGW